ncbi:hypothetical protein EBR43_04150 [bacterium]|nr:hypothetical protein [bacterium]
MSVESKIRELIGKVTPQDINEESATELSAGGSGKVGMAAASQAKKDTSRKAAISGDVSQPKQGSSKDAPVVVRDEDEENQGAKASASVSKNDIKMKSTPGATPNFTDTAMQPKNAVNQGSNKGNVQQEEDKTYNEEEVVSEEEQNNMDIGSIFGSDISEEFKQKATSIFEAAVIARVNDEMEKIAVKLQEENQTELEEFKSGLVDKIDSYLNYVVENWMTENQLAVEQGLRTEIAEDFIHGMKTLFKEHYVEVPDEKYDVMAELQNKADELQSKLDESMTSAIKLAKEVEELRADRIVQEESKGLADTEVEKFKRLVEGIDFENEDLYREKLNVVRENYFPSNRQTLTEVLAPVSNTLIESVEDSKPIVEDNTLISEYARALSRSIKRA